MANQPNAAPQKSKESKQPSLESSSPNVFLPKDIGKDDFFRLRRKGNGWIIQMVRVSAEHARQDVWEWDAVTPSERRLASMCKEAELKR